MYNFATPSVGKTTEAFDPKAGQVGKDEEGQLNI
jgi:hypothetical protein